MPILGKDAKLTTLDKLAAERGIARADAIAVGDGANDLPMLTAAGLGVAYRAKPAVAARSTPASTMATSPRCSICRATRRPTSQRNSP